MGYSKALGTLFKMEPALQELKKGFACSWDVPQTDRDPNGPSDAEHFAYKVREALSIAARNPERFPELAKAATAFKIQVVNGNLVQAVPIGGSVDIPVPQGTAVAGTSLRDRAMVGSVDEVKQAWSDAQPTNDPIHFPQAMLDPTQLSELAAWVAGLTPAWMLLRPKGTNALTLAPDDPRVPAEAKIGVGS